MFFQGVFGEIVQRFGDKFVVFVEVFYLFGDDVGVDVIDVDFVYGIVCWQWQVGLIDDGFVFIWCWWDCVFVFGFCWFFVGWCYWVICVWCVDLYGIVVEVWVCEMCGCVMEIDQCEIEFSGVFVYVGVVFDDLFEFGY